MSNIMGAIIDACIFKLFKILMQKQINFFCTIIPEKACFPPRGRYVFFIYGKALYYGLKVYYITETNRNLRISKFERRF